MLSHCASMPASLLLLVLCWSTVGAICPSVCSCSRGHRVVDCSARSLLRLPPGLQHNIRSLNLSYNSLQGVGSQLSHYAHLRTLDLSYNHLDRLPSALPRALWELHAAGNQLRSLDKNDTAYHWNLRVLDLSANELERVVFINNTLPSLHALNLSHNRFWTVPTNMPHNVEVVDVSHNYLVQILPGSLDRLHRLARFYLHANRFSWVPEGVFDRLTALEELTLGDNPWACEEEENITRLLQWAEKSPALILGCPCYTRPTCGRAHVATPGGEWHYASYTEQPLGADAREREHDGPPDRAAGVTSGYLAKSALLEPGTYEEGEDQRLLAWTATSSNEQSTYTSTTILPRSTAKRPTNGKARSKGHRLTAQNPQFVTLNVLLTVAALTAF